MEPKSPRGLNGLPEKPAESDMPVTESESNRITTALANPTRTLKKLQKNDPKTKALSVLVKSKLGGELVDAGVTNLKLAKTISEALDATKSVAVGRGKYEYVPDHKLRLVAWDMAMKSAGADAPVPEGDKGDDAHVGTLLAGMGIAAIEAMRHKFIEEYRRQEVAAGMRIDKVVIQNDQDSPPAVG